ncbi:MAG TPA: ATP-dependent DNA ligase [Solirubrobacteraceae bacterium]|jgi:ATP-dependent DNA ligase|nr:ATP-dependent DNA ligase [Solirubrobacteraceae bacterium]
MGLPLSPPVAPQLAKPAAALPEGDGWAYEPKYDGFRAVAFVDGEEVVLQSRNGKPLTRYFPELTFPAGRYVLDGEIVIQAAGGGEEFNLLGQRIHPAASRIARLAAETPATYIAFDLLAEDDEILLEQSWQARRTRLEARELGAAELTPVVRSAADAEQWLRSAEGVIAKQTQAPYRPGERLGMFKIKRVRTLDAVVMGWRPGKAEGTVGALILGAYDDAGRLREVGHSSGFKAQEKRDLVGRLGPYETGERGSGDPSRWTGGRDLEWVALRPELVVEVRFDHASDGRIRHGAKVLRWRDDKPPADCRVDQLDA